MTLSTPPIHLRTTVLGAMVGCVRSSDGEWRAFGYSNAAAGQRPEQALPGAAAIAEGVGRALSGLLGRGRAPEALLWAVNPSLRERAQSGVGRHVFRLERGGAARWVEAQADEPLLREWEAELIDHETRPAREQAAAEDAVVRSDGFLAKEAVGGLLCRLAELEQTTGVPRLWLFVPGELEAQTWVLRPWNFWIHPDHAWRPERGAAVTAAVRVAVTARVAGWLVAHGQTARVVTALPDAGAPIVFERVTASLPYTVLAFLRALGLRRPEDQRLEWDQNKGGELNVYVLGPIPVEQVRAAFRLPSDPRGVGAVDVTADKIEAGGGDLWVATIWAAPAAAATS